MAKFKALKEKQFLLLPPSVEDFVPEGHLARVVSEVVDSLDTSKIENKYSDLGQNTYHPKILLKILFYGYAVGVRSGRKISSKCETDTSFMYLAQMYQPDFRTINDFRKNNTKEIENCFVDIVGICEGLGMVKVGSISIDGTKIRANASARRSKDKEGYQKWLSCLEEEIQKILREAEETDDEEDKIYGDKRGDELPEDLRKKEKLTEKIREAVKELDQAKEKTKRNFTDPDARFMKERAGVTSPAYNCQLAVVDTQVIVAADVTTEANDRNQLATMVEKTEENAQKEVTEVIADSGYSSYENYEYLDKVGKEAFVPDQYLEKVKNKEYERKENKYHKENFTFKKEDNSYICPEGKRLKLYKRGADDRGKTKRVHAIYRGTECQGCSVKHLCTSQKARTVARELREELQEKARERLLSEEGRQTYKKRLYTVEPPFGHLKHNLGYRAFLLRTLEKVRAEFKLMCIGYNLRKIWSYGLQEAVS